jgi:hypothetical protein
MVMELARLRGRRLAMLMARPLVRPMEMGRRLRLQVLLTRPPIRGRLLGPLLLPRQQGPMALLMRLPRVFGVMARVLGLRVPVPVRAQALELPGPARVWVLMLVVLLVPKHPSARRKTKTMRTLTWRTTVAHPMAGVATETAAMMMRTAPLAPPPALAPPPMQVLR